MRKIFLAMMLLATFIFAGCNTQAAVKNDELQISILNIGNGDSILIRTKEQTILIDTAKPMNRFRLLGELEKFSVTKIDKLILTHPHADHIGNASALINPTEKQLAENPYLKKISVEKVFDNGVDSIGSLYMKAVAAKKLPRQVLKVGDVLDFGGGVKFKVIWPTSEFVAQINERKANKKNDDDKHDRTYRINNTSLVGILTYKDFSMMLTGDCEKESEEKILAANDAKDLKCDILKAGHHGGSSSSTKNFVATVNPKFVLISAGNKSADGDFRGAPHKRPLETYMAQGIDEKKIFCTQWNGTITVTTDGKNFSVRPEVEKDWIKDWIEKKKQMR